MKFKMKFGMRTLGLVVISSLQKGVWRHLSIPGATWQMLLLN